MTRAVPALLGLIALGGCGGGGGGGNGPVLGPVVVPFTSWDALPANSQTTLTGMSQSSQGNFTLVGNDIIVDSIPAAGPVDTANSSATLTFGSTRNLTGISVNAPGTTVSWDSGIVCGSVTCMAQDATGTSAAVFMNPYGFNWNYQTFGVWSVAGGASAQLGSMSVGSVTPVSAIPVGGTASYTGLSTGFYVDAAGQLMAVGGTMNANADFGARTVGFSTTGTQTSTSAGVITATPGLDMTGTLTMTGNQFVGAVNTANGQLTGSASGRFYGPGYEEIGGVYALRGIGGANGTGGNFGTGGQAMMGGFGGKR